MGQIEQNKIGYLFGGLDDTNNSGKTAEADYIDQTGQVILASSENGPFVPLRPEFVRAYDYENDIIGYVTRRVGSVRYITIYDIVNDTYIYNVERPLTATAFTAVDTFFINQNLFIISFDGGQTWTISKYTFPETTFIDSFVYIWPDPSSRSQIETNLDKIFLVRDLTGEGDIRHTRLSETFNVEVNVFLGGNQTDILAADTNYIYRKKWKSGDAQPYEMERGSLSYTGFSTIFTYGLPTHLRFLVAWDGKTYVSSFSDGSLRVFDSSGTLLNTFTNAGPFGNVVKSMYPIGLTQNYISIIDTGVFPTQIAIYDLDYNFVRHIP